MGGGRSIGGRVCSAHASSPDRRSALARMGVRRLLVVAGLQLLVVAGLQLLVVAAPQLLVVAGLQLLVVAGLRLLVVAGLQLLVVAGLQLLVVAGLQLLVVAGLQLLVVAGLQRMGVRRGPGERPLLRRGTRPEVPHTKRPNSRSFGARHGSGPPESSLALPRPPPSRGDGPQRVSCWYGSRRPRLRRSQHDCSACRCSLAGREVRVGSRLRSLLARQREACRGGLGHGRCSLAGREVCRGGLGFGRCSLAGREVPVLSRLRSLLARRREPCRGGLGHPPCWSAGPRMSRVAETGWPEVRRRLGARRAGS